MLWIRVKFSSRVYFNLIYVFPVQTIISANPGIIQVAFKVVNYNSFTN